MAHVVPGATREQVACRAGVVAVIAQRVGNGFRHDRARSEMHHGIDAALTQQFVDANFITGIGDDELGTDHGLRESGAQIVDDDDALAGLDELQHDVAADVAGAASDENRAALIGYESHELSSMNESPG